VSILIYGCAEGERLPLVADAQHERVRLMAERRDEHVEALPLAAFGRAYLHEVGGLSVARKS
jgi:hypothetical protein